MSGEQEAKEEVLDWLLRGVDPLDCVDAIAALSHYREEIRKDMARDLSMWIDIQGDKLGHAGKVWGQIARKIDPDKVPSKNGIRSFWNQEEWNT